MKHTKSMFIYIYVYMYIYVVPNVQKNTGNHIYFKQIMKQHILKLTYTLPQALFSNKRSHGIKDGTL